MDEGLRRTSDFERRWLPWRVNLPELAPVEQILSDAPGGEWPSRALWKVAAVPSCEQGAAATGTVSDAVWCPVSFATRMKLFVHRPEERRGRR